LLVLQLVLVVVFAVAAFGFARRAEDDEPLLQALAAGCVLAATARLHFFLYPSLYSDLVHIGDVVRLGFYAVLLGGASQQIVLYWRSEAEAAATEERHRMARELHDGLTQELSFIRSQSLSLVDRGAHPDAARHIADAADRAVTEARRLLGLLADRTHRTLEEALRLAAERVADRAGVEVEVRVSRASKIQSHAHEDLARIVAQATANAAEHGRANRVVIDVEPGGRGDLVTIQDDGAGFDPAGARPDGHGLRSMRERAEGLGGELRIRSDESAGTRLEVDLPR
jgi:signal transduction histidine kinase